MNILINDELRKKCIELCERPGDPIEYADAYEDPRDFIIHVFVKYRSGRKMKKQLDPFMLSPQINDMKENDTKRLRCEYCGCISEKNYGTCSHCGAVLTEA